MLVCQRVHESKNLVLPVGTVSFSEMYGEKYGWKYDSISTNEKTDLSLPGTQMTPVLNGKDLVLEG